MSLSTTLALLLVLLVGLGLGLALGLALGVLRRPTLGPGAGGEARDTEVLEGLDRLHDTLRDLEHARVSWQGQLHQQVDDVRRSADGLRRETHQLTTALRRPQVRGRWGELHLRRTVELAGLVDRCDFSEQVRLDDGAQRPDLVVHQPAEALSRMGDYVREMHTRSGLLDAVTASSTTLEEAGATTLAFLRGHISEPATVPLCGNSIGTDRRFLAAWLPEIEAFLHYRSIDVSTIKELARRWRPELVASAPTKAGGHRALDDIRESLIELRHYRKGLFPDAGAPGT